MIAYCVGFALSALLGSLSSIVRSGRVHVTFLILSGLPLVLLAALRSIYIGTDVVVYLQGMYWKSMDGSLLSNLSGNQEPLFAVLVWVATKLTGSLNGVMACVEIATITPFIMAINRISPHRMGIALLLYCLTCFLFSLNCMRQSIAVSLMLLGFSFLVEGRKKSFWAIMICAVLVHNTAVMGFALCPVYRIVQRHFTLRGKGKSDGSLYAMAVGIVLILMMTICFAPDLIRLLSTWRESFQYQVDHLAQGSGIVWKGLILPGALSFVLLLFWKSRENSAEIIACLILAWIGALLWQLSSVSDQLYRLGMPFLMFTIPGVLFVLNASKGVKESLLVQAAIVAAASLFCFLLYVAHGYAGTIPYQSTVLPFLNC